jgi:hypothetical protein
MHNTLTGKHVIISSSRDLLKARFLEAALNTCRTNTTSLQIEGFGLAAFN